MRLGDLRLQREHAPSPRRRVGDAREREYLRKICLVGGANLRHLRCRRQVVVPIGQTESALQQIRHVFRWIFQRLCDEHAEQVLGPEIRVVQRIDIGAERATDDACQRAPVGNRADRVQLGRERREAFGFYRRLIHEARVEIANLLRIAARPAALREILDERHRPLPREVGEHGPRPIAGFVSRNSRGLAPAAVRVRVEVVSGRDRSIHAGHVHAMRRVRRRRRRGAVTTRRDNPSEQRGDDSDPAMRYAHESSPKE